MGAPQATAIADPARPPARAGLLARGGRGLPHLAHVPVLAAIGLALSAAVEDTYPSSVTLSVSAVILKKVWVRLEQAPRLMHVGPEDAQRGWVDVVLPTVVTVRNNSADGFLFRFDLDPQIATGASLRGLPRPVEIGAEGASVALPGHHRDGTRLELRWRVHLAAGIEPGLHLWPVSMQVDPN